jgi:hypothetical protein
MKKPTSIFYILGVIFTILGFVFFIAGILSKYKILKTSAKSIGDPTQLFPLVGVLFLIIGIIFIALAILLYKQRKRIISTGYRIIGKIDTIKDLKYTHYGNRSKNPFIIIYSYQFEGIYFRKKSHLFWNRKEIYNPGNTINVFVDKQNTKKSVVGEESEF